MSNKNALIIIKVRTKHFKFSTTVILKRDQQKKAVLKKRARKLEIVFGKLK